MEKQIERQCRANAVFTDEAYLKTRYICREDGTYTIRVGRGERRDVLACKELYGKAVKTALEPFGSLAACLVYVTKASASFSSAFCRLTSLTTATSESNDGLTASSKAYWSADVASSSMSSASGRAFNACAHSALVRASFKYESPPGTTVTGTFAAVFAMPPSRHTGWTMTCRHNGPAALRD